MTRGGALVAARACLDWAELGPPPPAIHPAIYADPWTSTAITITITITIYFDFDFDTRGARRGTPAAMINAVLVFNNAGQPRLTKFYTQLVCTTVACHEA